MSKDRIYSLIEVVQRRRAIVFLTNCKLLDYAINSDVESKLEIKRPYYEVLYGKQEAENKIGMDSRRASIERDKQKYLKG